MKNTFEHKDSIQVEQVLHNEKIYVPICTYTHTYAHTQVDKPNDYKIFKTLI